MPRLWRFPGSRPGTGRRRRISADPTNTTRSWALSGTAWARSNASGILSLLNPIRARLTTLALVAAILALNVYMCWGLLSIEYLQYMGSVEGVFIGLARYITVHWRDLTWFPLWHLGMPYANTYPP